jgi:hypothetical protein
MRELTMAKGVKTGGRTKGTVNKMTVGIKSNILQVFEDIGGVQYFAQWAKENPTEFYKHYIKLLPTETNINGTLEHKITSIKRVIVNGTGN